MPVAAAIPAFLASLVATLAAARSFASGLDRLGVRFRMPEALIGLLTAAAADGPELSSALIALASGAGGVSVGVLVGSNVFNLAAMIGLSAVACGTVRLPRSVLALDGLAGLAVTVLAAAVLLRWLGAPVAAGVSAGVLMPYLALVVGVPAVLAARLRRRPAAHPPPLAAVGRSELAAPIGGGGRAVPGEGGELAAPICGGVSAVPGEGGELADPASPRSWTARPPAGGHDQLRRLLVLAVLDVAVIIAGSAGMVQSTLALGHAWHVSRQLLGVLVLAPLTSLPNAATALRLGLAGRGSALVGESFNSNTINLAGGVIAPALLVAPAAVGAIGRLELAWLLAMTALTLLLLARPRGLGRVGGLVLIALYLGFVTLQLVAA